MRLQRWTLALQKFMISIFSHIIKERTLLKAWVFGCWLLCKRSSQLISSIPLSPSPRFSCRMRVESRNSLQNEIIRMKPHVLLHQLVHPDMHIFASCVNRHRERLDRGYCHVNTNPIFNKVVSRGICLQESSRNQCLLDGILEAMGGRFWTIWGSETILCLYVQGVPENKDGLIWILHDFVGKEWLSYLSDQSFPNSSPTIQAVQIPE